jgi:hypothetical protein
MNRLFDRIGAAKPLHGGRWPHGSCRSGSCRRCQNLGNGQSITPGQNSARDAITDIRLKAVKVLKYDCAK